MAKPLIVKRNVKGSALTFTELDANFQNLDDATFTLKAGTGGTDVVSDLNGTITLVATDGISITGNNTAKTISLDSSVVQDTTPQLGGDLDVLSRSIYSSIDYVRIGNGATGVLAADGAYDLVLLADPENTGGQAAIQLSASTGDVTLSPGPGGEIAIAATTTVQGTGSAAPYITTNGSHQLQLTTNTATITGGTTAPVSSTSGFLQINPGTSGNVILSTSNAGTGVVVLNTYGNPVFASRIDSSSNANAVLNVRRTRSDLALASLDGATVPQVFTLRDNTLTSRSFTRLQGTYATSGGHSFQLDISSDNFTTTTRSLAVENQTLALGPTTTTQSQTVTTGHAGDLVLNTNRGTTSGSITITTGTNGAITLDPEGTGRVSLSTNTVRIGNGNTSTVYLDNVDTTSGFYIGQDVVVSPGTLNSIYFHAQQNVSGLDSGDVTITANSYGKLNINSYVVKLTGTQATLVGNGTSLDLECGGAASVSQVSLNNAGNIEIKPFNGTVVLSSGVDQTITTSSTDALTLNTNSGTNSGSITIADGVNANVTIAPNGTGQTKVTNLNYNEVVYTAGTTTGTITPDCANGTVQSITLTGSITFSAFATPISGQTMTMIITQPATGGPYTLTSTMKFAGSSKTLSTAANSVDILTVSYIGTTYYASLAKAFA
jgi:hypothetical protein